MAQRLWYHARRIVILTLTEWLRSGVIGQSSSGANCVSRASSSVGSGTRALLLRGDVPPRGAGPGGASSRRTPLDASAQPGQRPREARLDRPLRDAERRRSLVTGELEEVAAVDYLAVLLAQLIDGTQQPPPVLGRDGCRLGGWGRIPRAEALRHTQLKLVAPACGAHSVARFVGHDPQQPGSRLGACAEGRQRPVRLHEAFLRRILGLGRRARDHVGGSKRKLLVLLHDLLIGGRVPALGAREQLNVLRPALHRIASITPCAA